MPSKPKDIDFPWKRYDTVVHTAYLTGQVLSIDIIDRFAGNRVVTTVKACVNDQVTYDHADRLVGPLNDAYRATEEPRLRDAVEDDLSLPEVADWTFVDLSDGQVEVFCGSGYQVTTLDSQVAQQHYVAALARHQRRAITVRQSSLASVG